MQQSIEDFQQASYLMFMAELNTKIEQKIPECIGLNVSDVLPVDLKEMSE